MCRSKQTIAKQCRTGDGFVLVYSVNSNWTFEQIETFYDIFKSSNPHPDTTPVFIVGNKADLNQREVSRESEFLFLLPLPLFSLLSQEDRRLQTDCTASSLRLPRKTILTSTRCSLNLFDEY